MPTNKSSHPLVKATAGLAALAAAAGAYYFYGSKEAKKHRGQMKAWTVKAKADVMEQMEKMKELSQQGYEEAVSQVMDKYKKLQSASPKELDHLTKELKSHWKDIAKHLPKPPAAKAKTSKKSK